MLKKFWKYVKPTSLRGFLALGLVSIVTIATIFILVFGMSDTPEVVATPALPEVTSKPAASFASTTEVEAVGIVTAISEVTLKAEAGGQVTAVYTDLGKYVGAGAILAQFDNARERAALTSAQGAYDAALAGAQQSNSGTKEAQIGLASAEAAFETSIRNSYTTLSGVTLGTIDTFFSNPNDSIPGVRVNVNANILNADRVALRTELPALKSMLANLTPTNADEAKAKAVATSKRLTTMIDAFSDAVKRDGTTETLAGQPLSTYTTPLLSARDAVNGVVSSLDATSRAVAAAKESLARSTQAGSGSTNSLADAQIKIALGSLRAAQASYEKTLVRTPISGVVNSLSIKRGDYVSPLQDVALVANNNGLQVETAVTESDRAFIAIGDTVRVGNIATGTVTAIGGAVDPATGKIGVKVAVTAQSGLTNGTTVTVNFTTKTTNKAQDTTLVIPLKAVKLTADGAFVFSVNTDSTLKAHPVVLGTVLGDTVVVSSGIVATDSIIGDARGRKEGERVTVKN